jgi:RNase H-fold protein (predicted Holliday junction resolvase)
MARPTFKERQKEKRKAEYLKNVTEKQKQIRRVIIGKPATKPFDLNQFSGNDEVRPIAKPITPIGPPVFNRDAWGVSNG